MKILKKALVLLFFIVIGILVAATAFLHFANLDSFRSSIEKIATRAIDRQLKIQGHLDVNVFPHPEIALSEISLANAPWGTEPEMIRVGHFDASIDFLSLFTDMIVVRRVILTDVNAVLEKNDQRVGNWSMGVSDSSEKSITEKSKKKAEPKQELRFHLPVMVDFVQFKNISVTLREPKKKDRIFHLTTLDGNSDDNDDILVHATGNVLAFPMKIDGRITSKPSVKAHGAVTADIRVSSGDVRMTGNVHTGELKTLADLDSNLHLVVPDVQKTLEKADIRFPLGGKLTADFSARSAEKGLDVSAKTRLEGIDAQATTTIAGASLETVRINLRVDEMKKTLGAFEVDLPFTGLLSADATVTFDDEACKANITADVDGISTAVGASLKDSQLDLKSKVSPLRRIGELFDMQGVTDEPLRLKCQATLLSSNAFEIKQLKADIGDNHLVANGHIGAADPSNVSFSFTSPDLRTLMASLPNIDLRTNAAVQYAPKNIAVTGLSLKFDKSDLAGDFKMVLEEKKKIDVNLTSSLLDLRPFGRSADAGGKGARAPSESAPSPDAEHQSTDPYVFKNTPLQLAPLQALDLDAKIRLGHVLYGNVDLKDMMAGATLQNGKADATFSLKSASKGVMAGKMVLATRENRAEVDAIVSVSDYRMALLAEGIDLEEVPPVSLTVELKSAGRSPRELASSANGRVLLTQGPGKTNNTMLGMFSSDIIAQLINALNPFRAKESFTNWDCTVLSVPIVDGLATIDGLLVQQEKIMIVGGGTIDLKTEKLDIEFNTKPRSGVGISADMFVTPFIKLKGTLAHPGVGLNKKGTLLTGGAAFMTGGLSVLIKGALDRATAQGDHCQTALAHVGEHAHVSLSDDD